MRRLRLHLFGGFDARRPDGTPLVFARKKAQALLAYLALHPDQAHPRHKLATLLWSDVPEPAGRAGMRQALVSIRRAFPPGACPLAVDSDSVRLDSHRVEIDVAEFGRLAADGVAPSLAAAARLYRGPLLDGLRAQSDVFEEWLHAERTRLHELAVDVMGRLLAHQQAHGDLEPAVQTAVRLLALDPLQETVHRALMRLYARQGRRAAALRQYQACVDILHRELHAQPEPDTKRLYTEILSAAEPRFEQRADGQRLRRVAGPTVPLVGRAGELATLTAALDSTARGEGGTIVMLGEAGIGKSRLTAEAIDRAALRDFQVLVGQAYESEQILPFGVWVHALRAADVPGAALDGLDPIWRPELARLFPEVAPPPAHRPTVEDHLRLFEAIARLLMHVARHRPALVVLEDLHWADGMSVRLLPFVSRRTAGHRICLLVTAREEHLADAPALRSAIDEISNESAATLLTLAPLARAETLALVDAHASRAAKQTDVAADVWSLSEGNPFVALEALHAAEDAASPLPSRATLPDRVQQMIRGRLDRLGPAARRLADAAAVIGRDFDFQLLRQTVELPDRDAADGLEELVRRRVVRLEGENFSFVHDRLRHAAYGELLPPTRAALHLAVAGAIERVAADHLEDVFDRLGHHYTRAGAAENAVRYLALFAEQASRRYALDDAVAALAEARRHVARLPAAIRDRRLVELLGAEASYLFYLGRLPQLIQLLGRYIDVFDGIGDPSPAGACHAWLAAAFSLAGQHQSAVLHAERAIAVSSRAGDDLAQGQGHAVLALEAFWAGTPARGVEQARRAAALLAGGRDVEWLFYAHLYEAVNAIQLGELDRAHEVNRIAMSLAERAGSARLQTFAAWSTGWAEAARGEPVAAVEACRRAVSLAPDPLGVANALGFLGYAYLRGGDPSGARDALTEAVARSAEFGLRPQQGWFNAWLAEAHLALDDVDHAGELAASAIEIGRQVAFPYGIGVALRAAGRVALGRGDVDAARTALAEALAMFRAIPARYEIAVTEAVMKEEGRHLSMPPFFRSS